MTPLQIKIIQRAIQIRVDRGEDVDEVINSYTKLDEVEKTMIKREIVVKEPEI